ncbi:MAG: general secretion pathway protein GspB [Nevskia sp.]|nr:general secretion pathway protein GspB [Nevskia sp.]
MSLILDALKRAERERKLGQAPTALEEVAVAPPAARQTPGRRPILLGFAAVAVAALAAFALLRTGHPAVPAAIPAAAPAESAFVPVTNEPARPATPAAANPADGSQDARIEDAASIASLDDLTDADAPGAAAATADETTGAMQVDGGSNLVTPSLPPAVAQPPAPVAAAAAKPLVVPPPASSSSSRTLKLEPRPSPPAAAPASAAPKLATAESPSLDSAAIATPTNVIPAAGEALVIPIEEYVPGNAVPAAPAATPAPAPVTRRAAPAAAAAVATQPDPSASVRRLKDMPPAFRAEFPAITIDVHVYNDSPQRRFVLINGRRYREGEALSEGPRIAQIVPEGIVFDWRNEQVLYGSR